jgi:monooxygenase
MLQRSPTYIVSRPEGGCGRELAAAPLPAKIAYGLTRWKNVVLGMYFFQLCRRKPDRVKDFILKGVRQELGPDYDVATHFTPRYKPWDQRLCLVPDSDLFARSKSGHASVVTDTIESLHRDRDQAQLRPRTRSRYRRHGDRSGDGACWAEWRSRSTAARSISRRP